jgi:hypothetical protein
MKRSREPEKLGDFTTPRVLPIAGMAMGVIGAYVAGDSAEGER